MAFTYLGNSSATATSAAEIDGNFPTGTTPGSIVISVFAFEGVAAGSGPWIVPNFGQFSSNYIGPPGGWNQICWQAPAATGVGIEVWGARIFSGSAQFAKFTTAQNAVMASAAWSGQLDTGNPVTNSTVRLEPTAQVTGNQPAAPSVVANSGELVVACGGDLMGGSGFGTPSGFTNRIDAARSGAGTVEATIADATMSIAAATGPITFPNSAASTSTRGATATLVIVPAPSTPGSGVLLEAPMPPNLDLGPGYTLRVTALSTIDGSVVPGVEVSNWAVLVEDTGDATTNLEVGPFLLVPGPNA